MIDPKKFKFASKHSRILAGVIICLVVTAVIITLVIVARSWNNVLPMPKNLIVTLSENVRPRTVAMRAGRDAAFFGTGSLLVGNTSAEGGFVRLSREQVANNSPLAMGKRTPFGRANFMSLIYSREDMRDADHVLSWSSMTSMVTLFRGSNDVNAELRPIATLFSDQGDVYAICSGKNNLGQLTAVLAKENGLLEYIMIQKLNEERPIIESVCCQPFIFFLHILKAVHETHVFVFFIFAVPYRPSTY
jgi:hypothetical protein